MKSPIGAAINRPDIEQIAQSVFETMLCVDVVSQESPRLASPALTAAVYYAGPWKGAILIECSTAQASNWAARLNPEVADPPTHADTIDVLGELVNMVGGNLKPLLPPGTGLSMPSVVTGSDYTLGLCGTNRFLRVGLSDAVGDFRITLVEIAEKRLDSANGAKPCGTPLKL